MGRSGRRQIRTQEVRALEALPADRRPDFVLRDWRWEQSAWSYRFPVLSFIGTLLLYAFVGFAASQTLPPLANLIWTIVLGGLGIIYWAWGVIEVRNAARGLEVRAGPQAAYLTRD